VNHKRVYRLYRDDGLSLRLKDPGATSAPPTVTDSLRCGRSEMWSMDFVSDALFDGGGCRH
jgi:putative transposase